MIQIGNRSITERSPAYIIAEAGVNHNGSIDMAKKLIDIAKNAGADAVKFQSFHPSELVSDEARLVSYQKKGTHAQSQKEMLSELALSSRHFQELKAYCDAVGITFLATPFDLRSAYELYELGVEAFKISSGDLTFLPLLREIRKFDKPILLSTGMASMRDIENTLDFLGRTDDIVILHCTSNYPADYGQLHLNVIHTLKSAFQTMVGYSDHSIGIEVPISAVVLGYKLIEKHITLDRKLPGPDHSASLEPIAFKDMVEKIRHVEKALGSSKKRIQDTEKETLAGVRRGIYVQRDLSAGTVLAEEDLAYLRPLSEIHASHFQQVIGRKLRTDMKKGMPLLWEYLE